MADSSSSAGPSSSSAGVSSDVSSSVGGGGRRLAVRTSTQADYVVGRDTGYRVLLEVTSAEEMDGRVFRYLASPVTGADPPAVVYDGVCSPSDLEQWPPVDPTPGQFPAFCRRDSVDLVFRSRGQAEDWLTACREELQTLVDSLNRQDRLEAVDEMTFS